MANSERFTTKKLTFLLLASLVAFTSLCGHIVTAEDPVEEPESGSDDMDTVVTEAPKDLGPQPNDDADVTFLFSRPQVNEKPYEFPLGREVHFLVGLKNKGQKDLHVQTIDASFRYSLDFSYILQNFTSYPYNRVIEPNAETTVGYTLFISEQYAARAYGFTVNLLYSDKNGVQYQNAVFNETVMLYELDEGLDSQSFFLYLFLIGLLALIGYGINQLYIKYVNPSRRSSIRPKVEQETVISAKQVDYDWLPPSMVANLKKTSTSAANKKAPAN